MSDIRIGATNSLAAIDSWLKILSGNLTGSNVTGYRQVRAEFSDVLAEHVRAGMPVHDDVGSINPLQFNVGGSVLSGTVTDFTQGAIQTTNRATDLAVQGDSFFILSKVPNPQSFDDLVFTRNGSFHFDFFPDQSVYNTISGNPGGYDPETTASGYYRLVNQEGLFVMGLRGKLLDQVNPTDPKEVDINDSAIQERAALPTNSNSQDVFLAQFKNWGVGNEGLSAIKVPYCKDQGNNVTVNLDFDANLGFEANGLLMSGEDFPQDLGLNPVTGNRADLVKFVALAKFSSPDGLIKQSGSTEFMYNNVAGAVFAGIPATGLGTVGAYNTIVGGALETSNSSVNTALPELTIAQKSFTANVKVISVGNSMIDDVNQLIR